MNGLHCHVHLLGDRWHEWQAKHAEDGLGVARGIEESTEERSKRGGVLPRQRHWFEGVLSSEIKVRKAVWFEFVC